MAQTRKLMLAAMLAALMSTVSGARAAGEHFETRCFIGGGPDEYVLSIDEATSRAGGFVANADRPHVVGSFRYVAGQGTYVTFPKVMWFVADPESGLVSWAGRLDGSDATSARCQPFRAVTP
jgi:hypothetical protein